MKVVALYSGGKDSSLALLYAVNQSWDVASLITVIPEREDSWLFHVPNVEWVAIQAEAMGIPLVKVKARGDGEEELKDLKNFLYSLKRVEEDLEGVVSGVVVSDYQRARIDRICEEIGLKSFFPLWHKDPELLLRECLHMGLEVVFVGLFAMGFNSSWLGRRLDERCVEDLKDLNRRYGINMVGDGGEFETFVIDGPLFKKRVELIEVERVWRRDWGFLRIKQAALKGKL